MGNQAEAVLSCCLGMEEPIARVEMPKVGYTRRLQYGELVSRSSKGRLRDEGGESKTVCTELKIGGIGAKTLTALFHAKNTFTSSFCGAIR